MKTLESLAKTILSLPGLAGPFSKREAAAKKAKARGKVFAIDLSLRSFVVCGECGTEVNEGQARIVNPRKKLSLRLPKIALHAMKKHNSAFYSVAELVPCGANFPGGLPCNTGPRGNAECNIPIEKIKKVLARN